MKILCTMITTNTQVHTGKCYFLGLVGENKTTQAYDVEVSTSAATANTVGYRHANDKGYVLPKPGVECGNGLYVTVDGNIAVYWSLG